jgi:hypothetical protein
MGTRCVGQVMVLYPVSPLLRRCGGDPSPLRYAVEGDGPDDSVDLRGRRYGRG